MLPNAVFDMVIWQLHAYLEPQTVLQKFLMDKGMI